MNSSIGSDSDERLDAAIRSAFDDIIAATDPQRLTDRDQMIEPALRRHWLMAVAAVAVLVAGAVGLVLATQHQEVNDLAGASERSAPTAGIAWQQPTNVGSIAGASVDRLVGNEVGFVAAGSGLENRTGPGRVWFSPDGLVWDEPASDIFDAMNIIDAAATDEAFYVLASSSANRISSDATETANDAGDAQIYRSENGTDWIAWGEQHGETTSIIGAGSTLLRETDQYALEWSVNGDDWFPSELPADDQWVRLFLQPYGHIDGDATYVLGARSEEGTETDEWTIWSSLDDGRTWTRLPAPPIVGGSISMVETPSGLVVGYRPDAERCDQQQGEPARDLSEKQTGDEWDDAFWTCGSSLALVRFDPGTNQWEQIDTTGPGPTPSPSPITTLGDTLVAPILEPGKALTVWAASLEADDWTPDSTTTIRFADNIGGPETIIAAVSNDTMVIASPQRTADGSTSLLVGHTT